MYADHTDQTDIATIISLVTGTGLLPGSIGVPPSTAMKAFWPDPLHRLHVLSAMLHHLESLAECKQSDCSSNFLVQSERMLTLSI